MPSSRIIFIAMLAAALGFPLAVWAADPLPRAAPEDVGMSSERLGRIGKAINAEIAAGQLPGVVVGVVRRGKLVYFEAFGYRDKAAGDPMTTDSIFSLASMTKPLVAVGAVQLVEQGRLVLDDPLAKYFPRFARMQVAILDAKKESIIDKVPASRQIIVQDLFRHTSGFIRGADGTTAVHKIYPDSSSVAARTMTSSELLDQLSTPPYFSSQAPFGSTASALMF
jgi:CubicO group peptidase (beta-lactamase class C family)